MSKGYNLEDHGHTSQEIYDSYVKTADALADLAGKVIAITGTSTGSLGYYIAEAAVRKRAKLVLLLNRESERSKTAEEAVRKFIPEGQDTTVRTVHVDLQNLESVKRAAEEVNKLASENNGLDVFCANAGVMAMKDIRTADGFDVQMQTNMLSHFLLIKELFSSLDQAGQSRGEARVVMHSSSARNFPSGNLKEKFFTKCEAGTLGGDCSWIAIEGLNLRDGPWSRYHQTKLANACFAMALHEKLKATGSKVKSLAADPGIASTNLQVTTISVGNMSGFLTRMLMGTGQSPADGSTPALVACFGPHAESGDFYIPEHSSKGRPIKTIQDGNAVKKGGEVLTCNPDNLKLVWEACEKALDVKCQIS